MADQSKMYILVADDIPVEHALLAVGHGVLMFEKAYEHATCEEADYAINSKAEYDENIAECELLWWPYEEWKKKSFRKVICKVTPEQLEKAEEYARDPDDYVKVTEAAYDGRTIAHVWCPRVEWPGFFTFLPLYKKD